MKEIARTPAKEATMLSKWTRDGSIPSEIEIAEHSDSNGSNSSPPEPEALSWSSTQDVVGVWGIAIVHQGLLEQINATHDRTDYLWYTTT